MFSKLYRRSASRPLRAGNRRRVSLGLERLESRWLLAAATLVDQTFRTDDFTITGGFSYELRVPESSDYIDRMTAGQYFSEQAHVVWTSPRDGAGFFQGQAGGVGRSTVFFAGARRTCADYGLEDKGTFDFAIDAALSQLTIDDSTPTSTRYTYYHDRTGGQCPPANPVPSRFFGGLNDLYLGSFSPAAHTVAISYSQPSPQITVTASPAPVVWADSAPTDLSLAVLRPLPDVPIPAGWTAVPQTVPPGGEADFVDLARGLEFTVDVHGKPAKVADVMQPIATVRLFWATHSGDTSGAEIPINAGAEALGVYWNSSQVQARITDFPAPPAGATHVRVLVDAVSGVDAQAANSSVVLRIEDFQPAVGDSGTISEDMLLERQTGSLLAPQDQSDPATRVYAYQPLTARGAAVQVVDEAGGFVYDPTASPALQALAPGDHYDDVIRFLAIKHQALVEQAVHAVRVEGVNDVPQSVDDVAATGTYQALVLPPAVLLANDTDIDSGDQLTIQSVDVTSLRGVPIRLVSNAAETELVEIVYEPWRSSQLTELAPGQELEDEFSYTVVDTFGAEATARVLVTVTGASLITISPIATQLTRSGVPTDAIPILLNDPDGDAGDLQVIAAAGGSGLVAPGGLQVGGSGEDRWLVVTPVAGATGRVWITVSASDGVRLAEARFPLIVGTADDLDLDGVADVEEDSAPGAGDMDGDGQPDSRQPHVASPRSAGGNAYLNLVVPQHQFLAGVTVQQAPIAAGPASGALLTEGLLHFQVLLDQPGGTSQVWLRTDSDAVLNRCFQYLAGSGVWESLMYDTQEGARIFAAHSELLLSDGGRADQGPASDGQIIAKAALAQVARPWQNLDPEDVNNDGLVAPQDVLILINHLNSGSFGPLGDRPSGDQVLPNFLDPSGSGSLEPLDVLQVINRINGLLLVRGEGEALPWPAAAAGTLSTAGPAADTRLGLPPAVAARAEFFAALAENRPLNIAEDCVEPLAAIEPLLGGTWEDLLQVDLQALLDG